MIFPVPRQRAQAAVLEKAKPPVRCCTRTTPVPRQSGQVSAVVPRLTAGAVAGPTPSAAVQG